MDVGTQIAHGAVRAYVMGDRGAHNEAANAEDIKAMKDIVRDAIEAGALGFSTSRTIAHTAIDGEPVPGTFAAEDELFGIGAALAELGTGVFELAPMGAAGEDIVGPKKEVDWMRRLSASIGRPVTFALIQVDAAPDLWRELMDESLRAVDEGADIWPQIAGRATGLLSGHTTTYSLFDPIPAYQELKQSLSRDELIDALATPEVRERILAWEPPSPAMAEQMDRAYGRTFLLGDPPDYEPAADRSLAGMAAAEGKHPLEVAYDAMLANDGQGLLYVPILNYAEGSLDPVREMILHPRAASGLADGGAHCGVICDASLPTFMLTHWTRDRTRGETLPLELVVKKQTQDTARLYGMSDRGTVEPGMLADLNVIDYERLQAAPASSSRRSATSPPSSPARSPTATASTPAPAPASSSAAPADAADSASSTTSHALIASTSVARDEARGPGSSTLAWRRRTSLSSTTPRRCRGSTSPPGWIRASPRLRAPAVRTVTPAGWPRSTPTAARTSPASVRTGTTARSGSRPPRPRARAATSPGIPAAR